jgi:NADPH-dependent F420 reductase
MKTQSIAILGTGAVGIAIATGYSALGYQVIFGTRNPNGAAATEALRKVAGTTAVPFIEAASACDLAVVALPWAAIASVLNQQLAKALAGKIVIDTCNPVDFSTGVPRLASDMQRSAGETVQHLLSESRVVKAFNTITAAKMYRPEFSDGFPDMLIAGNDPEAKQAVASVIRSFGWRKPIDLGGIEQSHLLESLALIWIFYAVTHNHWTHGFSLLGQAA